MTILILKVLLNETAISITTAINDSSNDNRKASMGDSDKSNDDKDN